MILMMGFELVRSSIDKIMHPEALSFSVPALIVLLFIHWREDLDGSIQPSAW